MANKTNTLSELRQLAPKQQLTLKDGLRLAELQAALLLVRAGITHPGHDVRALAEQLGIRVVLVAELAVAIMTEFVRDEWIIVLRGRANTSRQRFALAHGLWQILTEGRDDLFIAADVEVVQQWTKLCAERFAASLFMPRAWVYRAWRQGLRDTYCLARHFVVSPTAMDERLRDLGLHDNISPDPSEHAASAMEIALHET